MWVTVSIGGEGEIRTHEPREGLPVFKSCTSRLRPPIARTNTTFGASWKTVVCVVFNVSWPSATWSATQSAISTHSNLVHHSELLTADSVRCGKSAKQPNSAPMHQVDAQEAIRSRFEEYLAVPWRAAQIRIGRRAYATGTVSCMTVFPSPKRTSRVPKNCEQPEKDQQFEAYCPASAAAATVCSVVIRWWGWRRCFCVVVIDVN